MKSRFLIAGIAMGVCSLNSGAALLTGGTSGSSSNPHLFLEIWNGLGGDQSKSFALDLGIGMDDFLDASATFNGSSWNVASDAKFTTSLTSPSTAVWSVKASNYDGFYSIYKSSTQAQLNHTGLLLSVAGATPTTPVSYNYPANALYLHANSLSLDGSKLYTGATTPGNYLVGWNSKASNTLTFKTDAPIGTDLQTYFLTVDDTNYNSGAWGRTGQSQGKWSFNGTTLSFSNGVGTAATPTPTKTPTPTVIQPTSTPTPTPTPTPVPNTTSNKAPTLHLPTITPVDGAVGSSFSIPVHAEDAENDTFTLSAKGPKGSTLSDGEFSWTPPANQADKKVTVTVTAKETTDPKRYPKQKLLTSTGKLLLRVFPEGLDAEHGVKSLVVKAAKWDAADNEMEITGQFKFLSILSKEEKQAILSNNTVELMGVLDNGDMSSLEAELTTTPQGNWKAIIAAPTGVPCKVMADFNGVSSATVAVKKAPADCAK